MITVRKSDCLFADSPDAGDETCLCSRCKNKIVEGVPLRILVAAAEVPEPEPEAKYEYRYCELCQRADNLRPWEHYKTKKGIYLAVDVTLTDVVLMFIMAYRPGEERIFKKYPLLTFLQMLDSKMLEHYVPLLPAPAPVGATNG